MVELLPASGTAIEAELLPDEPPTSRLRSEAPRMVRMAAALLSAQMSTWLVAVIGLFFTTRYLGSNDFGLLTTAGTMAGFTLQLAALGTTNYLIKEVARAPEDSPQLILTAFTLRLAAWLLGVAILVPTTFLLIDDPLLRGATAILLIGAAFDLIKLATNAVLQAHYSLGRVAIGQGLAALVAQLGTVALLVTGHGLLQVVGIAAALAVVNAVGTAWYYWHGFGRRVRVRMAHLREMALGSFPYLAWDGALLILSGVDILMLAAMSGPTSAGFYGLAIRLSNISSFVFVILTGTIFPALSAAGPNNPQYVRTLLARAVHLLLLVALPMATGIVLLADDLTVLIGGSEFSAATPVVMIWAGIIPLVGLDTLLSTALFAVDRQRSWIIVAWCGAIFHVALNVVTIPVAEDLWQNAAIGTAITTILTELLMGAAAWKLLGPYRNGRATLSTLSRALVACALMVVPVLVANAWGGVLVAVPAGAAVYGVAVLALRLIAPSDIGLLLRSFNR